MPQGLGVRVPPPASVPWAALGLPSLPRPRSGMLWRRGGSRIMGRRRRAGAVPPSEEERVARPVRIDICGPLTVTVRGEPRGREIRRQGRLVLAFLALERPRAVGRDELAQAVWGEEARPGPCRRAEQRALPAAADARRPRDREPRPGVGAPGRRRRRRLPRRRRVAGGRAARPARVAARERRARRRAARSTCSTGSSSRATASRGSRTGGAPSPTSPCGGANAWWGWPCGAAAPTSRRRSTTRARSSGRSRTANRRTRC